MKVETKIADEIQKTQLAWFGHTNRMNKDGQEKYWSGYCWKKTEKKKTDKKLKR